MPASTDELIVGNSANQSITIQGASAASVIINQTVAGRRIFNADPQQSGNIGLTLSNLTLQGATNVAETFGGGAVLAGGPGDSLTRQRLRLAERFGPGASVARSATAAGET